MKGDLRILGKETLVYGLSTVLARLLNFLLLPFYTHYLLPEEYGWVAIIFSYVAFLNYLFQYGMDQAYMRFAADKDGPGPEAAFSTAMFTMAASTAALTAVMLAWAEPLALLAGLPQGGASLARYAAFILAFDALSIVPYAELRLSHKKWAFVGIKSFNIAVNVAMNLVFVGAMDLGVRGVFLASLTASAASWVLLAPVLAQRLRPRFDAALCWALLKFGLPLVPAGLGAMMVQVIDRPILQHYAGEDVVGVYQANHKLGIFMILVVTMFDYAWRPFFLERKDKPEAKELFARVLTYYFAAACWISLALSLFLPDIVRLPLAGARLIHPAYWPGLAIVPVVLAGYVLHGAYINFMAAITIKKRTDVLVWVTGLGAAVDVGVNLWLVPYWGMMGAAWAAFAAYAAMASALYLVGQRLWPIRYEYGRLAAVAAAALISGGVAALASGAQAPVRWAVSAGVLLLAPAVLAAAGFLRDDELGALKELTRARRA